MARALVGDVGARPLLRQWPRDPRGEPRTAASRALESDAESRRALLRQLDDREARIRQVVARVWRASPSDAGLRPEALPALAPALRLCGAAAADTASLLDESLRHFVEAPHPLHLSAGSVLAEALLGWLCVRLLYASASGALSQGRLLGEVTLLGEAGALSAPGNVVLMRVRMAAEDLPRERLLHVHHNLMEAWRVARHLHAEAPPVILLACANVDFAALQEFARQALLPTLAPGEVHWGPTFFGFRLAACAGACQAPNPGQAGSRPPRPTPAGGSVPPRGGR